MTTVHRKQAIFTTGAPISPGALGRPGGFSAGKQEACASAVLTPHWHRLRVHYIKAWGEACWLVEQGSRGLRWTAGDSRQGWVAAAWGGAYAASCYQADISVRLLQIPPVMSLIGTHCALPEPDGGRRTEPCFTAFPQALSRADSFGHGLSPLRNGSNFMPDLASPARPGGHPQSLRHLLNGSGSAHRRQHAFDQSPYLQGGACLPRFVFSYSC